MVLVAAVHAFAASTQTITTTYTRNADGALTAVTRQVDAAPAVTTYLTWDDFTPSAGAPATGTVTAADGNLVGLGPTPGMTSQFSYDVRDRLLTCNPSGQAAVTYTYHPVSLLASSTLPSGNALNFYYDNTANARMVNTRSVPADQSSTGLTASFLGPVRYLSNGTEQVLLTPRKDTVGLYDAAAQSLSPYSYDPYGSSAASVGALSPATPQDTGTAAPDELIRNPFRYAGEYQDPACLTYYLRARWYLPDDQTFLSRDPADILHRYGYTGGNPIGRTDPSGLKYTGEDFSRGVDRAVQRLTPHILAYIEPVLPVWGQVLGGIELLGLLPSFFHHPTTQGDITFGFLAASIASESASAFKPFDRLFDTAMGAYRSRVGFDVALGASQTFAQSYRHGRVDVPALIQGIDMTMAGMFWSRFGAGIGYRPYGLTTQDADQQALDFFSNHANDERGLVYRVRYNSGPAFTTPWMEYFGIGNYHEGVLGLTREDTWFAEVGLRNKDYTWETSWEPQSAPSVYLAGRTTKQLMFAGSFSRDSVETGFLTDANPALQNLWRARQPGTTIDAMSDYSKVRNNCQQNAARVRANIAMFDRIPRAPIEDITDSINN